MKFAILAALALTGCATVSWTCDTRPQVILRDTHTIVTCPTTGNTVDITHPKASP